MTLHLHKWPFRDSFILNTNREGTRGNERARAVHPSPLTVVVEELYQIPIRACCPTCITHVFWSALMKLARDFLSRAPSAISLTCTLVCLCMAICVCMCVRECMLKIQSRAEPHTRGSVTCYMMITQAEWNVLPNPILENATTRNSNYRQSYCVHCLNSFCSVSVSPVVNFLSELWEFTSFWWIWAR